MPKRRPAGVAAQDHGRVPPAGVKRQDGTDRVRGEVGRDQQRGVAAAAREGPDRRVLGEQQFELPVGYHGIGVPQGDELPVMLEHRPVAADLRGRVDHGVIGVDGDPRDAAW